MRTKVLYLIDQNGPGMGGPFLKMWAFHVDVNPNKILDRFQKEAEDRGEPIQNFLDEVENEDGLRERLIDGFDVQGENLYFNLKTMEVEG